MKSEKPSIAFLLCLILLIVPVTGAQNNHDPFKKLIGSLRCSEFEWISFEGGPEKYALAVPIIIEGRMYKYQLDTGSPYTSIYGTEAERWG